MERSINLLASVTTVFRTIISILYYGELTLGGPINYPFPITALPLKLIAFASVELLFVYGFTLLLSIASKLQNILFLLFFGFVVLMISGYQSGFWVLLVFPDISMNGYIGMFLLIACLGAIAKGIIFEFPEFEIAAVVGAVASIPFAITYFSFSPQIIGFIENFEFQ